MKPLMLVVDDEPLVRMDLVAMAEEVGFDTVQAGNAAQALRILDSREDIRVVFTDIRMPGDMGGLELAQVIRDRWPPTAIIICSGNTQPRPNELPANVVFMSKPCSGSKVTTLLSSILEEIS